MGGPLADIGSNQQRLPKKTVQRNSFVQLQDENSIPTPKKTPEQDSPHYMASTKASISAQATASRSKLPRPAVTPSSFSSTAAKGRAWVALATKRVRSGRGKTPDHSNGALSAVVTARIAKSGVPAISSPLEKRLPSLPIAQISTSSPAKASRTLIDAAERPLRKSPGTPEEAEWPALSPERTSTSSDTARSSSAEHSIQDPEVSHAVEAQFMDKPIAVTVRQSVTDPARTLEDATVTSPVAAGLRTMVCGDQGANDDEQATKPMKARPASRSSLPIARTKHPSSPVTPTPSVARSSLPRGLPRATIKTHPRSSLPKPKRAPSPLINSFNQSASPTRDSSSPRPKNSQTVMSVQSEAASPSSIRAVSQSPPSNYHSPSGQNTQRNKPQPDGPRIPSRSSSQKPSPASPERNSPSPSSSTAAGTRIRRLSSTSSCSRASGLAPVLTVSEDADRIIYGDHPPPPPPKPRAQATGTIKRDSSNVTGLRKASEHSQKEPSDHGAKSSGNNGVDEGDAVSYKFTMFESPRPTGASTEGKAGLRGSTGASTSHQRPTFVNRTNFNRPLLFSEDIQSIGFPSRVPSQAAQATKTIVAPHTLRAPSLMNAKLSADLSPYSSVGDYLKQAESTKSSRNSMPRSDSKARLALSGIRSIFHKRDPKSALREKDPNKRMANVTSHGSSAKNPRQSLYNDQLPKTSQALPVANTPPVPSARLFVRPRHPSEYISESPSLESPAPTASSETARIATALIEQARSGRLDASEQARLLNLGEIMLHTANFHARSRQAMERAQQAAREAKLAHEMTNEALAAIVRIVHQSTSVSDLLGRR